MTFLEKIAASEKITETVIDHRGRPEKGNEYIPGAGLILAIIHQRKGKITILDNKLIKPKYFFRAWGIHLTTLIVGFSYLGSRINNYFQN